MMIHIYIYIYTNQNNNICNKVYTNFLVVNNREDGIECKSFRIICTDSFLVFENKYYPQIFLDNRAYKIVDKQITNYIADDLF